MLFDFIHSITETMPISSTAHVQVLAALKNITINKTHIIHLHLTTAFAGLLFVRKLVWNLLLGLFKRTEHTKPAYACFFITLIQVLLSFPIIFILNKIDANPALQFSLLGFCSIVAGLFLYVALYISNKIQDYNPNLTLSHVLPITFFQTFAFFPGVSRLGASLTAFKTLGFETRKAWEYSIALGIPLSVGASLLTMIKDPNTFDLCPFTLILSFLTTYFFYFIAVRIKIKWYALYKILFGITVLLLIKSYT